MIDAIYNKDGKQLTVTDEDVFGKKHFEGERFLNAITALVMKGKEDITLNIPADATPIFCKTATADDSGQFNVVGEMIGYENTQLRLEIRKRFGEGVIINIFH